MLFAGPACLLAFTLIYMKRRRFPKPPFPSQAAQRCCLPRGLLQARPPLPRPRPWRPEGPRWGGGPAPPPPPPAPGRAVAGGCPAPRTEGAPGAPARPLGGLPGPGRSCAEPSRAEQSRGGSGRRCRCVSRSVGLGGGHRTPPHPQGCGAGSGLGSAPDGFYPPPPAPPASGVLSRGRGGEAGGCGALPGLLRQPPGRPRRCGAGERGALLVGCSPPFGVCSWPGGARGELALGPWDGKSGGRREARHVWGAKK